MISPDSDQVYLPFPNKETVFDLYCSDLGMDNDDICSLSHFRKCWREDEEASKITIRKWLRFSLCTKCIDLRQDHENTKDPKKKKLLKAKLREHVVFVRRERASYYQRRREAIEHPEDVLSIIIDGADQQVYGLPYYYQRTHGTDKCFKIPLHLMGVLVHGRGSYGLTYPDSVKQGTNVTIDALHYVLTDIYNKDKRLPKKLYLQLDNTNKQCKNSFMLGQCV
jgi:hypothetical protein